MDAKSDQIFAEFSAKMGVASVREYEETRLKRQTEVAETRAAYKTQVGAWRERRWYGDCEQCHHVTH